MCDEVNAIFRCADTHKDPNNNPEGLAFKHYVSCDTARQAQILCPRDQRQISHVVQEDEPEKDCPACRGETPPETP